MRTLLTALALVAFTASTAAACSWGNKSTTAELDTDKDRDKTTASVEKSEPAANSDQRWTFDSNTGVTIAESERKQDRANN